jgi:hypothetical protein
VARGLWQQDAIDKQVASLAVEKNRGRVGALTIDMKSKESKGRNLEAQGYGMGSGKGMSIQGGMLDEYDQDGALETRYVDVVYDQISNQSLEESMTALKEQINWIRVNRPNMRELIICSDKCANYNAYEQVPFIVEGNRTGWGGEPGMLVVTSWTFTEAQCGTC